MIYGTSEKDISLAADILRGGGLAAIPTETVYGLAANALDPDAVANIFKAKGRPADNPLIVHIADIADLEKYAYPTPLAYTLADAFWPGPLTMILKKKDIIPSIVSAGLDTVAIRFPSHPVAQSIIRKAGVPLAAPSANKSGKPSSTKAEHVEKDYEGKICVIDAGSCDCGVESTVVSLVSDPPVLLRPGFITPSMLRKYVPSLVVAEAVLKALPENEKALSPGLKHRHYAPEADTVCVSGSSSNASRYIHINTLSDMRVCVICYTGEEDFYEKFDAISYGAEDNEEELASNVFDRLRCADSKKYDRIYVRTHLSDGVGLAVYNRLLRACSFNVVDADKLPVVIGVTGPSGSGKSVFCDVAQSHGFRRIDADKVYTSVLPSLIPQIEKNFGSDVILNDGTLNRKKLAERVFSDESKRLLLNAITHTRVIDEIKRIIMSDKSSSGFAVEAIGLIETGFSSVCNATVTVYSDTDIRAKRIISRDGITEEEAYARINAQKPAEYYISCTTYALANNDIDKFKYNAEKLLIKITEAAK